MVDCPCEAALARLRRDPRLATLPLAAKAMWLSLALHAAEADEGLLVVGAAYGLETGIAMLIQCAQPEVRANLDILIGAGFIKLQADTAIRVLGLDRPAAAAKPRTHVQVEVERPTPLSRARAFGRQGGRPRKGEDAAAARARRQRELMLPVVGGKTLETSLSLQKPPFSEQGAEIAVKSETPLSDLKTLGFQGKGGVGGGFTSEAKPQNLSAFSAPASRGKSLETPLSDKRGVFVEKAATRPYDTEAAGRIGREIADLIGLSPTRGGWTWADVANWLSQGISEKTIMSTVREVIESRSADAKPIGTIKYFNNAVVEAHRRRKPEDDLDFDARMEVNATAREMAALSPELRMRIVPGNAAERSRREMMLSLKYDDVMVKHGLQPLCFKNLAEFEHWNRLWASGAWISPYEDERAA